MNTRHFLPFIAMLLLAIGSKSIVFAEISVPPATVEAARAPVRVLRSPDVQKALLLDKAQIEALETAALQVDQNLWRLRDVATAKAKPEAVRLHQQFDLKWRKILLPSQITRADQLILQLKSSQSLQLPYISPQLGLSEAQARNYAKFAKNLKEHPVTTAEELTAKEQEWEKANLSEEQQAKFLELIGAPYDFSQSQIPETSAPELRGVDEWINTPPLTLKSLRGKVVVVNFWTFGCINCIHNLPHYKAWQKEYTSEPVVLLGIHTPETDDEHDIEKVKKAVAEKGLAYPIAIDNQRENWKAWGNNVWPSVYLIDKRGYVRYWWYGELNWKEAHRENDVRQRIRELLAEKDSETP